MKYSSYVVIAIVGIVLSSYVVVIKIVALWVVIDINITHTEQLLISTLFSWIQQLFGYCYRCQCQCWVVSYMVIIKITALWVVLTSVSSLLSSYWCQGSCPHSAVMLLQTLTALSTFWFYEGIDIDVSHTEQLLISRLLSTWSS